MSKKVDRDMDKKSSCKIAMNVKNGRRWSWLKNHLGLLSDDELLDYLLDLADSLIDRQGKSSDGDAECILTSNVESRFVPSVDCSKIVQHGNSQRQSARKLKANDFTASACYEKSKNVCLNEKMDQVEQEACSKPFLKSRRRHRIKCHRSKHRKRKSPKKILKSDLENDSIQQSLVLGDDHTDGNQVLQDLENLTKIEEFTGNLGAHCEKIAKVKKPSKLIQSLTVDLVKIDNKFIENKDDLSCNKLIDTSQYKKLESMDQSLSVCEDGVENFEGCSRIMSSFDVSETVENNATSCTRTDNVISAMVDVQAVNNNKDIDVHMQVLSSAMEAKNCHVEHLQNASMEPQHVVEDSISFADWMDNHKSISQVVQAVDSQDPMSKGYSNGTNIESDKEMAKQYKCDFEEKQEIIHPNWPLFSRESLPICLELKMTNTDHGLGVFAKNLVPIYTQFGPLTGQSVQEMDIPDDYSMKHIWEVAANDKMQYISTTNPVKSNWIRYMRPAESQEDKTVNIVKKNGQLFFVTCKTLTTGTELIFWTDPQSNSWTRKNRMDKTNCGGCNLKFSHPIYYRLHCCIFHDINYSLTIRKYHCKVCGTAVLGKDNIMKHAAQSHAGRGAYQCQYCKKFFLRLNYLEMHRTYGCSKNPSRSRPLCDFCGRKFCQPQKLKVHIKRMHSDTSQVLEEFQCKQCLKLLGSRAALARHMKEVHHKDVVGAAACDRCGKTFQNKSNLKIHMLTHSGVKPFKCQENECRAAFTTKQCLQFHYKKVHGLSDEMMPKIERSIAYTFDAYSGGLVEDGGRGKTPKFSSDQKEKCISSLEDDDDDDDDNDDDDDDDDDDNDNDNESSDDTVDVSTSCSELQKQQSIEESGNMEKLENVESSKESLVMNLDTIQEEGTRNEIHKKWPNQVESNIVPGTFNIDGISSSGQSSNEAPPLLNKTKLQSTCCKPSFNASLLVEAALDAAERDIGVVSIPSLEDNERGQADLYSCVPNEIGSFKSVNYPAVHETSGIDSFVHDELVPSAIIPNSRQAFGSQYRSYVGSSNRLHGIEQYLEQEIAMSPRYDEMVHQTCNKNPQFHRLKLIDTVSSDDSDTAVQNLSLADKDPSIQQQIETSNCDYSLVGKARVKFQSGTREEGLDMSTRGFQETCDVQNGNHLYLHHHHPFKVDENERQGVDLSISGPCASPSYTSTFSSYSHLDVSRVIEPTYKPHQLHTAVSRIIASPLPETLTPLSSDGAQFRILPSSASSIGTYNTATYSIGTSYHTPRSGYHYCNYY